MLSAQINALFSDIPPAAIKTGMLFSTENIEAIVKSLESHCQKDSRPPSKPSVASSAENRIWLIVMLKLITCPSSIVVIDPVMVSTSGHTLLQDSAISTLSKKLLPWATVVTPNTPEAEILAGVERGSIRRIADMEECAEKIAALGVQYVLVKGGHLPKDADGSPSEKEVIVDVLYDSQIRQSVQFSRTKMDSKNTHGTGCTLSAAICAELAKGKTVHEAVDLAGNYVNHAIATAFALGSGSGPVNHGHTKIQRQLPM